jgi:rhodanese-related sulfurtransferase/transcriptional regulator with XRE-family HTH domain
MIQVLDPKEAQSQIAAGGLDIIDVRDSRDWASGHIPGARNLPLDDLKAGARLARDRVLFVCARGMRSQTAARIAEQQGFSEVYSLDGGMIEWARQGLPIEAVPAAVEAAPAARPSSPEPAGSTDASCGLPEPGLEVIIGANLRALRAERGLSLDSLARLTGLGRSLLGQIELGKAAPSVNVVWKIARAFDVHFSALLATATRAETSVLRGAQATRLASPDGRFSSRALFPLGERPAAEFYELYLGPHSREDANPHQAGTRENLIVVAGRLELLVGSERHELARGDAIVFSADVAHAYVNPDKEPCWMHLVMTYARPAQALAAFVAARRSAGRFQAHPRRPGPRDEGRDAGAAVRLGGEPAVPLVRHPDIRRPGRHPAVRAARPCRVDPVQIERTPRQIPDLQRRRDALGRRDPDAGTPELPGRRARGRGPPDPLLDRVPLRVLLAQRLARERPVVVDPEISLGRLGKILARVGHRVGPHLRPVEPRDRLVAPGRRRMLIGILAPWSRPAQGQPLVGMRQLVQQRERLIEARRPQKRPRIVDLDAVLLGRVIPVRHQPGPRSMELRRPPRPAVLGRPLDPDLHPLDRPDFPAK